MSSFWFRLTPLVACLAATAVADTNTASVVPLADAPLTLTREAEEAPVALFQPPAPAVNYSDFGGVGHWRTPSARMAPDGEFAFTWSESEPYRLLSLTTQLLPRVEATARYVLVTNVRLPDGENYVDKGVDLKFQLLQESDYVPAVSLGLRDIAGTGLFSSEYVVASKRIQQWDFTVGAGWGNMASSENGFRNPLCSASERFCERGTGVSGTGGEFSVDRFFAGPISPFAAVSWQTPHLPLRLMAEVEGNDYQNELIAGPLPQRSPLNVGAVYRAHPNIDVKASFERGNTLSLGVSLRTNFNRLSQAKLSPAKAALTTPPANDTQWARLAARLKQLAGFHVASLSQRDNTLVVVGSQQEYRDSTDARERALRVLQADVAASFERFELVEAAQDMPLVSTTVQRHLLVDALTPSDQQPTLAAVAVPTEPLPAPAQSHYQAAHAPWSFSLAPFLQQSFGGVDSFYFYEVGAKADARYQAGANLLEGGLLAGLLNNYDFRTTNKPTRLPQVRIRVREYLENQPVRVEALQATRFFAPAPSIYAQAYGGLLELMFAGVGGEVLYRPLGATWGVGADMNVVRQRAPESAFGLESYQVVTGHVSYYQQMPWFHDVQLKLSAGQYLAGDRGVTVDFSRRFDSGVVLGAFATKTNVSAVDYGEGSFAKGFYLSIPLDLITVRHTQARATVNFVPIQRDGGSALYRRNPLWNITSARGAGLEGAGLSLGGY